MILYISYKAFLCVCVCVCMCVCVKEFGAYFRKSEIFEKYEKYAKELTYIKTNYRKKYINDSFKKQKHFLRPSLKPNKKLKSK